MAATTLAHGIIRLSVIGQRAVFSQLNRTQRQIAAFATGVTAVLGAVAAFEVKSSLAAAGEAKETEELFKNVFGSATGDARAFAREISTKLRASFFEVQEAMAVYQVTLKAVGLSQQESIKMTKEQIKLAFDIARAYNQDFSQAASNLRSSLLGVSQAGRKTGTRILQAELQQELYRMGITKTVKELDEKTKVLARHNALLRKTAVIEGQAEKEANFYNATLEGVSASFHELQVAIGQMFLPAATEMNKLLIEMFNITNKLLTPAMVDFGHQLKAGFILFDANFRPLLTFMKLLGDSMQRINDIANDNAAVRFLLFLKNLNFSYRGIFGFLLKELDLAKQKAKDLKNFGIESKGTGDDSIIPSDSDNKMRGGIIGFAQANARMQEAMLKDTGETTKLRESQERLKGSIDRLNEVNTRLAEAGLTGQGVVVTSVAGVGGSR